MEQTHCSTLTDCGCHRWTVVASPFCSRFFPISKHFLLGPLILVPHPLDLLFEDYGLILQYQERRDDLAK